MEITFSPELSEICGIHAGDGYLRGKDHRKELDISGNIEEKEYYDKNVKELFKKVFNICIECKLFKSRNTYGFVLRNKAIIEFLHNLGFPYGNKTLIVKAPEFVIKSNNKTLASAFLRGLFDTDGCIYFAKRNLKEKYSSYKKEHHYYPTLRFYTVSGNLKTDIIYLLKVLGFENLGIYKHISKRDNEKDKYTITLYGEKNIRKFLEEVGSKNPVKLSRFQVWKKFDHCPSKTTYSERLKMLESTNIIGSIA